MPGKLNIYNLGDRGVVVDKSPIHEMDGELLRAQNAQVDSIGALGGIRKRDGMSKLNSSALAGVVTGLISLPLPDERNKTRTYYLPLEPVNGNTWKTSTDETSWTDVTTPTRMVSSANSGIEGATSIPSWNTVLASFRNKLYYPGNDYTGGTDQPNIRSWDGTTEVIVCTIPDSPFVAGRPLAVTSMIPYSATQLIVCVADALTSPGRSRVFLLDVETGQLTPVGQETDLFAGTIMNGVCVWQGRIWVAGQNSTGGIAGKLYSSRPGDATWTLGFTHGTGHGYCTGMAVFKGNLYTSWAADVGSNADIYKRTNLAVDSEVFATDGNGAGNNASSLIVNSAGTKIFAYLNKVSGGVAPKISIIESSDGSTWTTSFDISNNLSDSYSRTGMPVLDPSTGDILWPLASGSSAGSTGGLLRRTSAGVWSVVLSTLTNIRGPLGYIKA